MLRLLIVSVLLAACGAAGTSRSTVQSSAASAYTVPTTPCEIHAGEVQTATEREGGPSGETWRTTRTTNCYVNAECVSEQGVTTPGDGSVELQCEGHDCVCRVQIFGPPPTSYEKRFDAECESSDQQDQLLRERCLSSHR